MTGPAPVLQFRVTGTPAPRGSYAAVLIGGKARLIEHRSTSLRQWMRAITSTAKVALYEAGHLAPLGGPVRFVALVALPKPAAGKYPRPVGRNAGDWDKLGRAISDALTDARVWLDDGQVTDGRVVKDYPGPRVAQTTPGVIVRVWHDTDDGAPSGQIPLLAEQDPRA